jgi:hypothetical protein
MPAPPAAVAPTPPPAVKLDAVELANQLLIHQNNLANLRQQGADAGKIVPTYVTVGIDFELANVRRIEEDLKRVNPPLQIKLKRFPESNENAGEERVFRKLPVLLGRSNVCDWKLDNSQISQFHARLVQVGDQIGMEDLGSTNGGAIIRSGALVHRFQPRMGADADKTELLPVKKGDLLYVATSRMTVEDIGEGLVQPGQSGQSRLGDGQSTERMGKPPAPPRG